VKGRLRHATERLLYTFWYECVLTERKLQVVGVWYSLIVSVAIVIAALGFDVYVY
jgi:hypothetical protein